jgi:5-oxoprolinase (ATP-hydrolysing)
MAGWQFWIDRGGTFTDIVARGPDGQRVVKKLLSENPERYADAAVAGIKEILGVPPDAPIPPGALARVKMGTTVATNALLERQGARCLLLVNAGFRDLLRIGNQARPRLFDLDIVKPDMLFEEVAEVSGRIGADGGELAPLDEAQARAILEGARARGIEAVAIALIHAWKYPAQEQRLGELARAAGFTQVSLSHEASPLLRLVPRADTTLADAYLSPVLRAYVARVTAGLGEADIFFMQSHGGLAAAAQVSGKDAILSGPAGGVTGAVRTAAAAGFTRVIGFDMGGTSTDVALYDGAYQHDFETEIAGIRLRVPMLSINTVAAGGGSVIEFAQGRLRVGPRSAGAQPGPAAYGKGGPLTVTDANVLLGKIRPAHFPRIFGPNGDAPLDEAVVAEKFSALAAAMADATGQAVSAAAAAEGALRIAVANMAHAVRKISTQRGLNPADFTLNAFGGAGGQHACLVADELGMARILIHPMAGLLSAYGIGLSDFTQRREQAVEVALSAETVAGLKAQAETLAAAAAGALAAQMAGAAPHPIPPHEGEGVATSHGLEEAEGAATTLPPPRGEGRGGGRPEVTTDLQLLIRYAGTDTALQVALASFETMHAAFTDAHRRLFGFVTPERGLIAEAIIVEARSAGEPLDEPALPARAMPPPLETVRLYSGGTWHDAPVFERAALGAGARVAGPAILREANATTVIEPGWTAEITARDHCVLTRATQAVAAEIDTAERADPVLLELFNNLFMAIAEQAGTTLQHTAQSVNIKERLDFSCAIFDAAGRLIANAPHVPVHLGAMGASVRHVIDKLGTTLRPGDAIALNDPYAGGTHLPDITLITPVFDDTGSDIRFFAGARAHHADVGGLTPGSTPPFSKTLEDEGVVIDLFPMMRQGELQEDAFRALLAGARHPARNPDQNIGDMKAQIAANETARLRLAETVGRYGWPAVQAYMGHVRANAEEAIRGAITTLRDARFDYEMDSGAPLRVSLRIDHETRAAVIDFTGTGPARDDNFNAPRAVTTAAVLYAFRCLLGTDLALNEGCLAPLTIIIPDGCFLSPPPGHAVVAGNTEVSQAVTSALLGAMGAAAASQSTMNNFLFGNARHQYYETICGGAGATPRAAGADAVHTHMTNTRITDPEVLELRYPVRLDEFSIRAGSGGAGAHPGGDGAVRRLTALEAMTATIVASRRRVAPFGLQGGGEGATGTQRVERADGRVEPLGGSAAVELAAGDAIVIETPGGGGFGAPGTA